MLENWIWLVVQRCLYYSVVPLDNNPNPYTVRSIRTGMVSQTIEIGELSENNDAPYPRELMETVSDRLSALGYENSIVEVCAVPSYSELKTGAGRTPSWVVGAYNPVKDLIFDEGLPFDLKELASKTYESVYVGEGSEHVTTFVNYLELSVVDVIDNLNETGQLQDAVNYISTRTDDKTDDNDVLAYAIWTYAKGWVAERLITDTDRYAKLWVTNDQAGQDVRDLVESKEKQVKCVTFAKNKPDHIYYQWDMNGKIHLSDSYTDAAGAAIEGTDMCKTVTYRCHSTYRDENGDTYRYIWW